MANNILFIGYISLMLMARKAKRSRCFQPLRANPTISVHHFSDGREK